MIESEGYTFRRIRFAVGDREVWLEWNDRPDGTGPLPFTLSTLDRGSPIEVRIVTEADEVGWRRAPDPAEVPESDSKGAEAAGPGPEEQT